MNFSPGYLVSLIIFISIYALFGLGLNLQWGFTGLINFGHVAFMAVGAYTTVLLSLQGVPLFIGALIGAALAALLGLFVGVSTLRLREDYLAIVTIGLSEMIRLIVNNQELPVGNGQWRSGVFGLQGFPLPFNNGALNPFFQFILIAVLTLIAGVCGWQLWRWMSKQLQQGKVRQSTPIGSLILAIIGGIIGLIVYIVGLISLLNTNTFTYKTGLMVVLLLVLTVVFWALERLVSAPWGRVLKAIREDEQIPKALGKNVFWYKLQSLMLGGAIAGFAGAFYAWQLATVYPDNFQPQITFDAWTIVILGGAGNNYGTLLGAIIYWAYFEGTRFILPGLLPFDDARLGAFRIMVIGLLLIILMMVRPQGILGKKEELTLGK